MTKFVRAIALLTAFAAPVAFAQDQTPPKASKAGVQKVVDDIKSDKTKLAQFCELTKLAGESGALAQKNRYDAKLGPLQRKMDEIASKLGPDYEKVTTSDLDENSAELLDALSKSCK
jgi:hypothetical protein